LSGANLNGANLRGADLRGADLLGANLLGVNLICATGNNNEIKTIQLGTWLVVFTKDIMSIGCQQHKIEDWFLFKDYDIDRMHEKALDWWGKHKQIIKIKEKQN
jgi:hypothetical protein